MRLPGYNGEGLRRGLCWATAAGLLVGAGARRHCGAHTGSSSGPTQVGRQDVVGRSVLCTYLVLMVIHNFHWPFAKYAYVVNAHESHGGSLMVTHPCCLAAGPTTPKKRQKRSFLPRVEGGRWPCLRVRARLYQLYKLARPPVF